MANYKCLIVEDSPMMRQLLYVALSRIQGLTIVEAEEGMDGLKKLNTEQFDIVIVDINMPVMDGLKLVKHIRSAEKGADIPIIIVTTEGAEDDKERALQLGVNVYLTKPVHSEEIIRHTKELLNIDR